MQCLSSVLLKNYPRSLQHKAACFVTLYKNVLSQLLLTTPSEVSTWKPLPTSLSCESWLQQSPWRFGCTASPNNVLSWSEISGCGSHKLPPEDPLVRKLCNLLSCLSQQMEWKLFINKCVENKLWIYLMCMYVCIYIYIYIYTHTYTLTIYLNNNRNYNISKILQKDHLHNKWFLWLQSNATIHEYNLFTHNGFDIIADTRVTLHLLKAKNN